ncbi:MAG: beta-propeller fold lactonase family protein [Terracidiphilus sp.]|jgi:6-phosphogluconolactonase (cycloisomerase 2 family)
MKTGKWARLLFVVAPLLIGFGSGCGDFWQAPSNTGGTSGTAGFSLSNSGAISVSAGATTGNTATVTVTPSNSFTGTVSLTCSVGSPTAVVSATTCSLSPTSVSISNTEAQTATLTAATSSSTPTGAYEITVTGTSGSVSETTSVCVAVGTSTSNCSTVATTSGIFYVLNQTANQIVAFNISSGALNTIGAYDLPASPAAALAVSPNGNFLYVSTQFGIYVYSIGTGGVLTEENGDQPISSDPATTMQVDATGNWLVDAISGTTEVFAIAISPSTGILTSKTEQPFTGGLPASTVSQLAISPGDSSSCGDCYVFVAMGNGGTEIIHFNPSNANPFGSAGTIKLANAAGGDNAVAVDPTNRLLYVGESDAHSGTQSGGLRVFTISTTAVNEISGSPYTTGGTGPSSILPTSDGNYVYVANQSVSGSSTGNIAGFSVSTSLLTSVGTVAAGPTGQLRLAEDSTHSYVLAVDFAGNPDLEAYTFGSGTLTSVLTSATGTGVVGAFAIAAAP